MSRLGSGEPNTARFLSLIQLDDVIAVRGSGPVGLMAIKTAFLLGAERGDRIDFGVADFHLLIAPPPAGTIATHGRPACRRNGWTDREIGEIGA
jgi:hypothetical protein